MSESIAEAVSEQQRAVRLPDWGTIRAVNTDGTVTLETGRGLHTSAPALASYQERKVDDRVRVEWTTTGPLVAGRVGSPPEPVAVVELHDAAPGAKWRQVSGVYYRDGRLWVVPTTPITPPTGGTVTILFDRYLTYRNNAALAVPYAEQGNYTTSGMQTGLMLATPASLALVVGKTPLDGVLELHRRNSAHGSTAGTSATVFAATYDAPPATTPATTGTGVLTTPMARNETRTTAVSGDWLAGFGAGTSKSLVLSTTRLADNVEIDAATLTIRY